MKYLSPEQISVFNAEDTANFYLCLFHSHSSSPVFTSNNEKKEISFSPGDDVGVKKVVHACQAIPTREQSQWDGAHLKAAQAIQIHHHMVDASRYTGLQHSL